MRLAYVSERGPKKITKVRSTPPPKQTIPICLASIRPMSNSKILVPNSISAVDKLAHAINTKTVQTVPMIGINDLRTSLISCALRDSILANKVIKANVAKSDVRKVWLMTDMVTQRE